MRFLHTADWHLGKILHKHPLEEDMDLFFEWMCKCIITENIDTLIVAGDIFDLSNPAITDRRRYYHVLSRLSTICEQVIITGGNHDSVGMLNAPSELLEALNITVVGGVDSGNIGKEIIPIYRNSKLICIVLAVPFLRDRDIKLFVEGQSHQDKIDATRQGIKKHYLDLVEMAKEKYGDKTPILATGHLYLQGASVSDSERDISIGNLDSVDHAEITSDIDYLALGHIHRPQKVDEAGKIRYSGSPIPLSFSEKNDLKRIIIGEVKESINVHSIPVPNFRKLIAINGSVKEVEEKLKSLTLETPLPSLIEVTIIEPAYDPSIPHSLSKLKEQFADAPFKIIKDRIEYLASPTKISELYESGKDVEDLNPKEVFDELLDRQENMMNEDKSLLKEAYAEIVEQVYSDDKNS